MSYNFDFSQANPLKGYILSDKLISFPELIQPFPSVSYLNSYAVFNPNYNTRSIDEDIFIRNIKSWQQKRYYGQPYQHGDTIRLQFLGQTITGTSPNVYTSYIVSCETQRIVKSFPVTNPGSIVIGGQTLLETTIPLHDIPEGYYYVVVKKEDPSSLSIPMFTYMVFEPINLRAKHDNTILIEYKNSYNAYGIIYESGINYMLRIHGFLGDLVTNAKFNVYEDEPLNTEFLSGIPYRVWKLFFGGNGDPIPDWMADKLNIVLLHDNLKIDGVKYVRQQDAKLEAARKDRAVLYSWSINIREADNDNNVYNATYQNSVIINTDSDYVPNSPLIYVRDFVHSSPSATKQIRRVFYGYSAFIGYMNSEFKKTHNILGSFGIDAQGRFVFKPGSASEATAYATIGCKILPYPLIFNLDLTDSVAPLDLQIDFDNNFTNTTHLFRSGLNTSDIWGTSVPDIIVQNYPIGNKYTAFFFLDRVESIDISNSSLIPMRLDGLFPADIQLFNANNIPIKGLDSNIFKFCGNSITTLNFNSCDFNSNEIDKILKYLYDSITQTSTLNADLQQTVAAPASLDVKKIIVPSLQNFGVSLLID